MSIFYRAPNKNKETVKDKIQVQEYCVQIDESLGNVKKTLVTLIF